MVIKNYTFICFYSFVFYLVIISQIYYKAKSTEKVASLLQGTERSTHTERTISSSLINLTSCLWTVGGYQSTLKKPTQAPRENVADSLTWETNPGLFAVIQQGWPLRHHAAHKKLNINYHINFQNATALNLKCDVVCSKRFRKPTGAFMQIVDKLL